VDRARLKGFIQAEASRLGFNKVGFAWPEVLGESGDRLGRWLDSGSHGTMGWMTKRHAERVDPERYYPEVQTVVSLAMNYYTGPHSGPSRKPRWSNYAWGDDYHRLIKKRIKLLLEKISREHAGVQGLACVDTSPVMEKVWAQRAGLGWQGKHTNLITRDFGSWVFLGELLLNVEIEPDPPFQDDLCGSCTACQDACPTDALTVAYQLDANRCISYLTIEYRGPFDHEDEALLNGWIYGCDICQEVCPWNVRFSRDSGEAAFKPREFIHSYNLEDWQTLDHATWDDLFRGSAARRATYQGLKRNIRAVAGDARSLTGGEDA